MTRARLCALAALALLGLAGCFRTTVYSGRPPGETSPSHDNRWKSGLLGGLVELGGPEELDEACPGGWAELSSETGFHQALLEYLTLTVYSPQSVSVVCATPGASATPPLLGYRADPAPRELGYPPSAATAPLPPPAPRARPLR